MKKKIENYRTYGTPLREAIYASLEYQKEKREKERLFKKNNVLRASQTWGEILTSKFMKPIDKPKHFTLKLKQSSPKYHKIV